MKRAIGPILVLLSLCPSLLAQPQFRNAGAGLFAEQWTNKVVESGERVTVSLALKNIGTETASNLIATIQSGDGVSDPFPEAQHYGLFAPCGPSVSREFTFTADAPTNSLLEVKLDLADSARSLGEVTFRFRVGPQISYSSNTLSVVINEAGLADPYPSVLTVSNAVGSIVQVSVTLTNLSHHYPDDLEILLESPSGDTVVLMSDAGGSTPVDNVTLTFRDDAPATLPDTTRLLPGDVRPTNYGSGDSFPSPAPLGPHASVMSAFNGKLANGDWKLYVLDDFRDFDGLLESGWILKLTTFQPVDVAPTITSLGKTNNMLRFAVGGRPGNSYAVESSPNPCDSLPLQSFIMPATGLHIFEYPIEPGNLFFRAATEP